MKSKDSPPVIFEIQDCRAHSHDGQGIFFATTRGIPTRNSFLLDYPYLYHEYLTIEEMGQILGGN